MSRPPTRQELYAVGARYIRGRNRRRMVELDLHGARMGAPAPAVFDSLAGKWREGTATFEVFEPAWWRLDLWAWWFWAKRVRKIGTGSVTVTRHGETRELRVFRVDPPPRIPVEQRVRSRLGF